MNVAAGLVAFLVALIAGAFGAVLGIGGGLFVIPSLTLFLHVKLKTAIAASIVAVIATSLSGGNVYLRERIADMRLGLLLAVATAPGAVGGAAVSSHVSPRLLAGLYAAILGVSAVQMMRSGLPMDRGSEEPEQVGRRPSRINLRGHYIEPGTGREIRYQVTRVPHGMAVSTLAGLVSGLLGVGGGIVQVPVMNLLMHVPLKVATTTSTYIIGITAMAAAFVYYNGRPSYMDPALAVPVTLGVVFGAAVGSRALTHISQRSLRIVFTTLLAIYTVQMLLRFLGIVVEG